MRPSFRAEHLQVAFAGGEPIGFALGKCLFPPDSLPRFEQRGWITLMAVAPSHQRQGVGRALLAAVEGQLRTAGVTAMNLGESLHHALPGIPEALDEARAFFFAQGYAPTQDVWDVRGDVSALPPGPHAARRLYRPAAGPWRGRRVAAVPGRDLPRPLDPAGHGPEPGGRAPIGHVMGLFEGEQLRGFAQLHVPGSPGALRWASSNPTVAALGPIGVSKTVRGKGLGLALLEAGLANLRGLGATDTVIDWTTLLDFLRSVGFKPWLHYQQARKELA